jgi:hypothetical protein
MSKKTKLELEIAQSLVIEKLKKILEICNDPTETIYQRLGRIEAICETTIKILE